ncbi:MAG: hypothetical protein WAS72_02810 [Saprospiraceae bacterium]
MVFKKTNWGSQNYSFSIYLHPEDGCTMGSGRIRPIGHLYKFPFLQFK